MKKLLFLFLLNLISYQIFSSQIIPTPFKVAQPNGDSIMIVQCGDEYGFWYETLNGCVVEKNASNFWVYVTSHSNYNLNLTNQIVNNTSFPVNINWNNVYNSIEYRRARAFDVLNHDSILSPNLEDEETAQAVAQGEVLNIAQAKAPAKMEGEINVLTILIQFQDVKFEHPTSIKSYFENLMEGENFKHPSNGNIITGSVREYWEEASYGQLIVNSTVVGPYTANFNRSFYGTNWIKDNPTSDAMTFALVYEAACKAARDVNMSHFDNNEDGIVDFVHVVFAGDLGGNYISNAIWPHKGYMPGILRDWVWISKYIITSELSYGKYASIGTICHEMGHAFGAPDFYDRNDAKTGGDFVGTSMWDLMASGDYNDNGNSPAHPNPYIKTAIYGWATATELSGNNREYILSPSELDGNSIYKLSTLTPGEYYLLENRQNTSLPGTGLVIYHVNSGIENVARSKINIQHPQNLYVVDASNNLAKPTGSVASYDTINSINAPFRSTHSKNMYFTSESLPSNSDWEGNITQNKDVCFISEVMENGEKCIKFVLNPEIEGPDILCDSAIYSLKHVPSKATIEWTYTRPSGIPLTSVPLYIGSGQGTKAVYYKRGIKMTGSTIPPGLDIPVLPVSTTNALNTAPYSGFVTISAKVTLNGNTFTLSKEIYMPEKVVINDVNLGSLGVWYVGAMQSITLQTPTDDAILEKIRWDIKHPNGNTQTAYGSSVVVRPNSKGTLTVTATYLDGCGDEYESYTKTFSIVSAFNLTFANPASGSVEINVTSGDVPDESGMQTMSVDNQQTPYMGAYRVELWHDIYGKVREMDVSENNPTITMNLEGLNSGVYVLRLIIDNQVEKTSQLIVK